MTARKRLPDRRASETFSLECAGLSYVATVSRFDDGPLCRDGQGRASGPLGVALDLLMVQP